jgi:hypothetical protein
MNSAGRESCYNCFARLVTAEEEPSQKRRKDKRTILIGKLEVEVSRVQSNVKPILQGYEESITRWNKELYRTKLESMKEIIVPAYQLIAQVNTAEAALKADLPERQRNILDASQRLIKQVISIVNAKAKWENEKERDYEELLGIAETLLVSKSGSTPPLSLLERQAELRQRLSLPDVVFSNATSFVESKIRERKQQKLESETKAAQDEYDARQQGDTNRRSAATPPPPLPKVKKWKIFLVAAGVLFVLFVYPGLLRYEYPPDYTFFPDTPDEITVRVRVDRLFGGKQYMPDDGVWHDAELLRASMNYVHGLNIQSENDVNSLRLNR